MKNLWVGMFLLAALPGPASAINIERFSNPLAGGRSEEVVAEQIVVRFSKGSTPSQRADAVGVIGGSITGELAPIGWTSVGFHSGMRVASAISLLRGNPAVEAVEANHVLRPNRVPNDPLVSQQYALNQINAFAAWEYEVGTSCMVTIAVIDSGIKGSQPDLSGKLVGISQCFTPDDFATQSVDNPPTPACGHATQVSGIAAASTGNGLGIAGVSWGAKLLSLKVMKDGDCNPTGDCPRGACGASDIAVSSAILYAQTLQDSSTYGKIVINISLGGTYACPSFVQNAIDSAVGAGVVIVVAAGNEAGPIDAPANCNNVIPVGATDSNNNIAYFSNSGPQLAANGVVAPGVAVLTINVGGGTSSPQGTSFAAPHVSGLAALILAAKPTCPGAANCAAYVRNIIRSGADNIGVASLGLDAGGRPLGSISGAGRINAFRSMRLAVKGTLADFEGDQKAIAFPNPFRASQTGAVSFTVPTSLQGKNAKIKIYAMSGEFIRELPGLTWDGRNAGGYPVATGTYVFVVSTDKGTTRGRVAVIR